jgi:hypothetical protein
LEDQGGYHTWALIEGVAISTLIGYGNQFVISGQSDLLLSRPMFGVPEWTTR